MSWIYRFETKYYRSTINPPNAHDSLHLNAVVETP